MGCKDMVNIFSFRIGIPRLFLSFLFVSKFVNIYWLRLYSIFQFNNNFDRIETSYKQETSFNEKTLYLELQPTYFNLGRKTLLRVKISSMKAQEWGTLSFSSDGFYFINFLIYLLLLFSCQCNKGKLKYFLCLSAMWSYFI